MRRNGTGLSKCANTEHRREESVGDMVLADRQKDPEVPIFCVFFSPAAHGRVKVVSRREEHGPTQMQKMWNVFKSCFRIPIASSSVEQACVSDIPNRTC